MRHSRAEAARGEHTARAAASGHPECEARERALETPGKRVYRHLLRTAMGYGVGIALLVLYGDSVCPLMRGLGTVGLAGVLAAGFMVALAVEWLDWRRRPDVDPVERWKIQFLVWAVPGIALIATELTMGADPQAYLGSAGKLLVACMTLGFLVSSYVSLDLEHEWICACQRRGKTTPKVEFVSIASRILAFTMRALLGVILVIAVLLLEHENSVAAAPMMSGPGGMVAKTVSVLAVLVVATGSIARKYGRLFKLLYRFEKEAIDAVRAGRYDVSVPLVSHDEFRLIAEGTNEMIAGLRERERIRSTFGKYVPRAVADRVLGTDGGPRLGGEQKEVSVFFTDLRNYTPLSERLTPAQIVRLLNQYFEMVVGAVHRNGGMLDKFIGDAAMAVFEGPGACDAAVRTAIEVRRALVPLRERLERSGLPAVDNGIGIHHGPVVAGNIGSEERLEYTVIGDTVNVASRLESLTRQIENPVAVSEAVFRRLSPDLKSRLVPAGAHELKGKTAKLAVYVLSITFAVQTDAASVSSAIPSRESTVGVGRIPSNGVALPAGPRALRLPGTRHPGDDSG
jgi:adenylate cyclase